MKKESKYIVQQDMQSDLHAWPPNCAFPQKADNEHMFMHRYGGKRLQKMGKNIEK